MYKSFEIHNFKCFRELKLDKLARINLIAGMNNAGKTALLEAIFLHSGVYELESFLRLSHVRNIKDMNLSPRRRDEHPFGFFFNQFNVSNNIEILGEDTLSGQSSTQISVSPYSPGSETTTSLILKHKDGSKSENIECYLTINKEGGIGFNSVPSFPLFETFFHDSGVTIDPQQQAELYGELQVIVKENYVFEVLKIIEPRLKNIESIAIARGSVLHGDIGIGHLIPLHLMGGGITHLTNYVLRIANIPNGVILIDEIENGLHYSVMTNVWKAIASAAKEYNTQVFATTHSWECVLSAHEAFEPSETYDSDFRLYRLDRLKDDEIKAVAYDRRSLDTAIKAGLEVR